MPKKKSKLVKTLDRKAMKSVRGGDGTTASKQKAADKAMKAMTQYIQG